MDNLAYSILRVHTCALEEFDPVDTLPLQESLYLSRAEIGYRMLWLEGLEMQTYSKQLEWKHGLVLKAFNFRILGLTWFMGMPSLVPEVVSLTLQCTSFLAVSAVLRFYIV